MDGDTLLDCDGDCVMDRHSVIFSNRNYDHNGFVDCDTDRDTDRKPHSNNDADTNGDCDRNGRL